MSQLQFIAAAVILAASPGAMHEAAAMQPLTTNELVGHAMNAVPDAARGRDLYQRKCSSCHGQQAWGVGVEAIPALAGQQEFYLVTQLAGFVTQDRTGSTMHHAVSQTDVTDPQALRDLAAYLSAAPAVKSPEHGDGLQLASGKRLFESNCAACHGRYAEGRESEPVPRLAGQHYPYILSQLKSFAAGHRNQVEPPVLEFTAGLSGSQQAAIADYVSRAAGTRPLRN
jgi:cytochrome c553